MERRVEADASLELVGARLDDGVQDAAEGLAELRLEPAGLDLDLVEEVAGHSRAQGAVGDVVGADAAVSGVGDVDPVDEVGVLQARGSADGEVAGPGAAAADDAGRRQEEVAVVAADGN